MLLNTTKINKILHKIQQIIKYNQNKSTKKHFEIQIQQENTKQKQNIKNKRQKKLGPETY